jgi:hypothetical protein
MNEAELKAQLQRLLESGDRNKMVRAIARLLRDEQKQREWLDGLRKLER